MKTTSYLSTATGLLFPMGLVLAPAAAQSTGLMTLFLPDSEPLSLEASAVAVNTVGTVPVITLEVACPTAASPDNDACRRAGIYPAQVYHTQGSVWGGTTTYSADDSTTTWVCTLGGGGITGLAGECTKTIVSGGGSTTKTRTETAQYEGCYVAAHQRPIVVTAGVDKIDRAHYYDEIDASKYISIHSSLLADAGCPASQTTMWAGAVASSTTGAADSTGAATGPSSSDGSAATTPTTPPTGTGPAPSATTSSNGAGRLGKDPVVALLLVALGATMVLGVF
ncbi:hypothetical protein C8A00DRAFT_45528 [Chaetomidium leptoderma]|uniref:Uncharacterized protein n=1 Tax=Chaetomidium leptoderma TaxID=669021 RepID=A0AAN6ZV43_9PEZI|nr:hypothetical protein C8A00DRAFT_45528 [Chaetomidium leptoderma]